MTEDDATDKGLNLVITAIVVFLLVLLIGWIMVHYIWKGVNPITSINNDTMPKEPVYKFEK